MPLGPDSGVPFLPLQYLVLLESDLAQGPHGVHRLALRFVEYGSRSSRTRIPVIDARDLLTNAGTNHDVQRIGSDHQPDGTWFFF